MQALLAVTAVILAAGFAASIAVDTSAARDQRVIARNRPRVRPAWEPTRQADWEKVAAAWCDPGPVPEYHRAAQERLRRDWPALAEALDKATRTTRP